MTEKALLIYRAAVTFMLLLSVCAASFAWFSARQASDTPAAFGAGTADNMTLEIGQVPHLNNTTAPETNRAFTICNTETQLLGFENLIQGTDSNYHISLSQMQFGAIDNIYKLNPENIVYLRLTIPAATGKLVNFKLYNQNYSSGYHFNVYKNVYDENENIIGQKNVLEDTSDTRAASNMSSAAALETSSGLYFLHYQYCLTSQYVADGAMVDGNGNEVLDFSNSQIYNFNEFSATSGSQINTQYNGTYRTVGSKQYYYLYLKIYPDLTTFSYSAVYLTEYMPCYITFNIGAEFEVLPSQN